MKLPLTINQLQTELKAKKYSAVEIVDTYLSAIRKHDTTLNAFITITDEYAYKQAKNIDETIQNNPNAQSNFRQIPPKEVRRYSEFSEENLQRLTQECLNIQEDK